MKKKIDPKMHSAEHILNQTMVRKFDCDRCISAHIEKKKSKCDYHFNRGLTDEEVQEIEAHVNEVILADMPVREEYMPKAEAVKLYSLQRLPEDADEMVRIVKIGDYDACPCIGPHVSSTDEIGWFRIISTSFENGMLRIRFKLPQKDPSQIHMAMK
jgi:Ser-tRNA(Ala) deacylase AlaX